MVRAAPSFEAGLLSLPTVLRKTLFDRKKPFQPRDVLQEPIFRESGASQSWLTRCDSLAWHAVAVCEHRFLPVLCILEKTWGPVVTQTIPGRDAFFQPRSLPRELTTADSKERGLDGKTAQFCDWQRCTRKICYHYMLSCTKMKPDLTMHDFLRRDRTPATIELAGRGSLRPAYLGVVQLRFHRIPWNVNSSSRYKTAPQRHGRTRAQQNWNGVAPTFGAHE